MTITMHAIPHSGTRNEGTEPRANMIWRIRSKLRQPNFIADGATDHPDRWSRAEPNSDNGLCEWSAMSFCPALAHMIVYRHRIDRGMNCNDD